MNTKGEKKKIKVVLESETLTETARILNEQSGKLVHGLGYMRALLLGNNVKELRVVLTSLSNYTYVLSGNASKVNKMVNSMIESIDNHTFQLHVEPKKRKGKGQP